MLREMIDLQFIVGGALVGFIVGVTGVGGGSLMTPLLTLAFGVPAQVAVGTDLLFAGITKAHGAWVHARRGNVDWSVTAWLAAGSLPASMATLFALHAIGRHSPGFDHTVARALGLTLMLTATALIFKEQIRELGARLVPSGTGRGTLATVALGPGSMGGADARPRPVATMVVGALIGALVTLTSVGAGAIGVVALLFLYPRLEIRRIVGADVAHAVPLTLLAGLGHVGLGAVNWSMLIALLIGSLPAITLGAAVAHRVPDRALRIALSLMLLLLGGRLLT
jgi:uncharacterized membrane protein YfcA